MWIKEISCGQFAGIRDKKLELGRGLNVIYGPNESGKSTLIDLARILLFQSDKIGRKKSQDKEFERDYFPADTLRPHRGDTIDGTLVFAAKNGTYILTKKWKRSGGEVRLITPDGARLEEAEKIEEILGAELKYGAGIYRDIIFAPQKFQKEALWNLLRSEDGKESAENVKREIRGDMTATQALLESDGITFDALEQAISGKLKLYGERWDDENDMPQQGSRRGIDHIWEVGRGYEEGDFSRAVILRRFYALERKKLEIEKAVEAEENYEKANAAFHMAEMAWNAAEQERKQFETCYQSLRMRENEERFLASRQEELEGMKEAWQLWPTAEENLRRAEELKKELADAKLREKYEKALECRNAIEEIGRELQEHGNVSGEDKNVFEKLIRERERLESQVRGLNLSARIRILHDSEVRVLSGVEEKELDISNGEFDIRESVLVSVPEVMELELSPKGIRLEAVKKEVDEKRQREKSLLKKYGAEDETEFLKLFLICEQLRKKLEIEERKLETVMAGGTASGGTDFEALKELILKIGEKGRNPADIQQELNRACGGKEPESYMGWQESRIRGYEERYGSRAALLKRQTEIRKEVEAGKKRLKELETVPEEFLNLTDIDAEKNRREREAERKKNILEECREELSRRERLLFEKTSEELTEELAGNELQLEKARQEYRHWKNIERVFFEMKKRCLQNPMQDMEESLRKYLRILADGAIGLVSMNDRMDVSIVSHENVMAYPILSEGTKDTVYLAFRLAVLEHLYPEGGGMAVFDDPFTDMDEKRRTQACRLIQEFAEKNQVLFATCDERYRELFNGTWIRI